MNENPQEETIFFDDEEGPQKDKENCIFVFDDEAEEL